MGGALAATCLQRVWQAGDRPTNFSFLSQVRKFAPEALRVLDTQDLHSLRDARHAVHKAGGSIQVRAACGRGCTPSLAHTPTPLADRLTVMKKLRIVDVRERWHGATENGVLTMDKAQRRWCSPRYGLQSCRGKSAGVAKRPRERSPTRNPIRYDSIRNFVVVVRLRATLLLLQSPAPEGNAGGDGGGAGRGVGRAAARAGCHPPLPPVARGVRPRAPPAHARVRRAGAPGERWRDVSAGRRLTRASPQGTLIAALQSYCLARPYSCKT